MIFFRFKKVISFYIVQSWTKKNMNFLYWSQQLKLCMLLNIAISYFSTAISHQGPVSIKRPSFPGMEMIPMSKIRQSRDCLISNIGDPYVGKTTYLYWDTPLGIATSNLSHK